MRSEFFPTSRQYNVAIGLFLLMVCLLLFPQPASAQTANPHLSLSPTVKEVKEGVNFTVTVSVDTANQSVSGVDAIVKYDSSLLEVVSVSEGTFFPTITTINTTLGKVEIYGVADSASPKSGTGTLAIITFRGKDTGTATVSFSCQQGITTDSNINSTSDTDIITCADNINASYIIAAATATDSSTQSATSSTSSSLPQTGSFEPTMIMIGGGFMLMLLGLALIL
jgi:hypothetical protein